MFHLLALLVTLRLESMEGMILYTNISTINRNPYPLFSSKSHFLIYSFNMSNVTISPFSPNHDSIIANNVDFHLQQAEDCLSSASCSVKSSKPLIRSSSSPCNAQIPPPPWRAFQPARKASLVKKVCKPCDDPFLIAMKECTKSSKRSGVRSLFNIGKITLSCKHGSEVREDGLVRLSQVPSISRERSTRGLKI